MAMDTIPRDIWGLEPLAPIYSGLGSSPQMALHPDFCNMLREQAAAKAQLLRNLLTESYNSAATREHS